jgi:hypothetical protein
MTQPRHSTEHGFTYAATLAASQRINWQIDDIIGGDKVLDFSKPFMPESLARVRQLDFLDRDEQLALNHIRGHGYLYIFGLVEEFILPFVLDHARHMLDEDDSRTRALLQFAGEEAKHIQLFKRFRKEFERGFGTSCEVIGPPATIAKAVLAHHPLSVALVTLHIEWMVQRHYVDSVKDDQDLDPQFKSLLKHHWMEEVQHAKLDTLMVETIAASCTGEGITKALEGYGQIGAMIDGGLAQQVSFDLDAFMKATGCVLTGVDKAAFERVQRQAQRWTFLGSGMTHPNFLRTVNAIMPGAAAQIEKAATEFC